jgi:hypothetical protein
MDTESIIREIDVWIDGKKSNPNYRKHRRHGIAAVF